MGAGTMTHARAQLQARQKKHPPLYPLNSKGFDRGRALAGVLSEVLPPELKALIESGEVTVGEVGEFNPIIATYPLDDRQFSIEINTGLMDFYFAVGRALGGTITTFQTSSTPVTTKSLGPVEVSQYVAQTFDQWRHFREQGWLSEIFHSLPRIFRPEFTISDAALNIQEALVTGAELYMLAHEFGHVAIGREFAVSPDENEEKSADALGVDYFIAASVNQGLQWGWRMALASPPFAVRVVAGLECIGIKFARQYPPAKERLDAIFGCIARRYCKSEQIFDEASTISVSYLDLLDAVDNRITPGSAPKVPDAWRTRVRIIAELEEVAQGRLKPETFSHDLRTISAERSAAEMSEIITKLQEYYMGAPAPEAYVLLDVRKKMGEALQAGLQSADLLSL